VTGNDTQGHYRADVKNQFSNTWYRTSDNDRPQKLSTQSVTKTGYIFLYKQSGAAEPMEEDVQGSSSWSQIQWNKNINMMCGPDVGLGTGTLDFQGGCTFYDWNSSSLWLTIWTEGFVGILRNCTSKSSQLKIFLVFWWQDWFLPGVQYCPPPSVSWWQLHTADSAFKLMEPMMCGPYVGMGHGTWFIRGGCTMYAWNSSSLWLQLHQRPLHEFVRLLNGQIVYQVCQVLVFWCQDCYLLLTAVRGCIPPSRAAVSCTYSPPSWLSYWNCKFHFNCLEIVRKFETGW